ncbi:MAG: nucleoside kinase [Clostridiales bacterium]|nr:nucleoside kinase [Clostridiales bacterium]MCF8023795.1 nucleoside kinase [Clostridiales bacterium]
MSNEVQVQLYPANTIIEVTQGTPAKEITGESNISGPILAAKINYAIKNLHTPLQQDCILEFITLDTEDGMRIYERSLIMVLIRATWEVLPNSSVSVKHSLGNGVYGEIDYERPVKDSDIRTIEKRMQKIIENDEPIIRRRLKKEEVVELFRQTGETDKLGLLKYRQSPSMDIHTCGGFHDYSYGTMVPSTGYLKPFRLRYYLPGFILELPRKENPGLIPEYEEQGKLAHVYFEAEKWGKILGVHDVVSLNDLISREGPNDLIRVTEALHEKKISKIADLITENIDNVRIVLIAGPSSSGKTTFAQRLSIQLKVNGIQPVAISLDDYFVNRENTPLDENGDYDFECLDAVDYHLFNQHLIHLVQGEKVELPKYNFTTGKREYHGNTMKLNSSNLIIVEGIHALNDTLTHSIPKGRKFKIYVSPLTQLSLDNHNRIPTTDLRILRRIVRDYHSRGYTARETISRWPSVRSGEEKYIFPFQEHADVMFNSALVYELSGLKNYAEPLLAEINQDCPEHPKARRLRKFLSYFLKIDTCNIPANSIIREFIGESCF